MRFADTLILAVMLNFARLPGQPPAQADSLRVEIRNLTERASYGLNESIELDVKIINGGSKTIGVFAKLGMGYQGGLILHVRDASRAEVQPPTLAHDFLDLAAIQDAKNYLELRPGQFLETKQRFSLRELISKPGHYKLFAEYHCPVETKYAKVANFWSIDRKSVVSPEIEFRVE